ncbi:TonB-dependent receptor [Hymenobacter sp. BT664]|uniref:TonB-dependent receptor n=1 Tax=Hymenobacter montanus TaxID=2771359 RepID=A0A927GJX3_9BACT|nr:TonB-dependent receptor [Hymenobacter montanus]MBD2768880.1 TonB-dependent receptor [Hymenobacter montanus]
MYRLYYLFFFALLLIISPGVAQSQDLLRVSGRVITEGDESLPGATVLVSGTFLGSGANSDGNFIIPVTGVTFPLMLNVSYVGYETQAVTVEQPNEPVTVTLIPARAETNQIVVAASRQEENILRVPVTVEKVNQTQIRQLNQPDLFTSLTRFKGIDVNVSSMLTNSISTRGFNSASSERVIQLVDYMDVQAPSLSSGAGNSLGLPDIDVASVEVLYGPSSALYGANAFNGVVLLNSRDAFTDEGLSVRLRGGQRDYLDGQLRYARRLGRRWAFKLTGSYLTALDWIADNSSAQQLSRLVLVNNPTGSGLGYDAVNRYGDVGLTYSEDPSDPTYGFALAGRTVFMPGWTEGEMIGDDNRARLYRVIPSLSYLLTDKVKATLGFEYAQGTTTLQNTSRFRSKNFATSQYRFAIEGGKWFVRAFQTQDFGNESYNLGNLGNFMQNSVNPNSGNTYAVDYFTAYAQSYNLAYFTNGGNDAKAQQMAQAAAAATQLKPSDPEFEKLRRAIALDNKPGRGARITPSSYLNDVSGQYSFALGFADLIVGGAYREFRLGSRGNLFDDADGQRIHNYEYGGYTQLSKTLLNDRLKLAAAGRLDNFKNFDQAFSPRVSAVYSLGTEKQHNFRGSFARAFRAPTQIDQYTNIDLILGVYRGNVGSGFRGYKPTLAPELQRIRTSPNPSAALAAYAVDLAPLRLEQVNSYEVGYKGLLAKNLVLDLSYYFSLYRDFVAPNPIIGNLDGSRPSPEQLTAASRDRFQSSQLPTRVLVVASNLDLLVRTQGALASLTYTADRSLNLTGNYSFNSLINSHDEVPFYNTPRHKFNLGAYGELTRYLGYNVNYRWAQANRYESTFAAGDLDAYHSFDAQLRYGLPKIGATIEIGGSNILNTNNVQAFGGPQIGRLVYGGLSVSVN